MTAKEKAKEIVNRYINLFYHPTEQYLDIEEAKQCALIAVDVAIEYNDFHIEFLQEVKQEIINL